MDICKIVVKYSMVYIDVRGMTTDFNEFVLTFCPCLLRIHYSIESQNISENEELSEDGDICLLMK